MRHVFYGVIKGRSRGLSCLVWVKNLAKHRTLVHSYVLAEMQWLNLFGHFRCWAV